ncbi:hypothetical protein KAX06_05360, partial [candidate division WOR-3 bacterium]|nr:hypothetical protein [candidate division WOR-3 bacterium]
FLINIWRASIKLSKWRHQERARKTISLVRLEIDGSPHINRNVSKADQQMIKQKYGWPFIPRLGGTHIHIYIEGYGDRWAFPISIFPNLKDVIDSQPDNYTSIIAAFLRVCNFSHIPPFVQQLRVI